MQNRKKEEFILGETFYGFSTTHILNVVPVNKYQTSYILKTFIQFPEMLPIFVNKSEQLMSNFSTHILCINSKLNLGKFVYNQNNGDFYFEVSSNHGITTPETQKWQKDAFIKVAHDAIRFHLPRILFAAGLITTTEVLAIEWKEGKDPNKIRKLRPDLLMMLKYLDIASYKALLATDVSKADEPQRKGGYRARLTYRDHIVPPEVTELEDKIYDFIDALLSKRQGSSGPTPKEPPETILGDEYKEFSKILHEEYLIMGLEPPEPLRTREQERIQQAEADRFISANVKILDLVIPDHKIMVVPRLCSLFVVYGQCEFSRKGINTKNSRKCNLLLTKFPEESEITMARNAKMILEYLGQQEPKQVYNLNILPHYLKEKSQAQDGFYAEFNKHGTIENFVASKRNTLKFLLLVIKAILNAQIFLSKKHKMVHLDTQLYNIYITRAIQAKVGFLNKAFVYNEDKLKEMGNKEGLTAYKKNMVLPTNYMLSAKEIFQDNSVITEKTAVYNLANTIMHTIFDSRPQTKKKAYEVTALEKLKDGKLILGYTPTDLSLKGSIEVMEPLHVFTRACLEPDAPKRPSLIDMGVFISICLKSIDALYT